MVLISEEQRNSLLERFIRYVKIWTTSDSNEADKGVQPSTQRQFNLARLLEKELTALGLSDVQVTDHCYVYAKLEATPSKKDEPSFCLLAHMDTVEECSGENVNPVLTQKDGDTIIKTDGTTLLGADDKAGISEIMEMLVWLKNHSNAEHPMIEIVFSPDEETGHGMDNVPLSLIKSKQAYTVDGGNCGEIETECFNAWKSEIIFNGVSVHTGTARGVMVNAVSMASAFISSLPRQEAPETTDVKQGFYAPMSVKGSIEKAGVIVFLRDFTKEGIEKRKAVIEKLAESAALSYGGSVHVLHTEQYKNMKEGLDKSPGTVNRLIKACKDAGIEPVFPPIRGGTDGSRLTELGIPSPNIFTGGHCFHSKSEWASLNEMCKALEVLIHLAVGE
jgi:tripeptide aminopeptidase